MDEARLDASLVDDWQELGHGYSIFIDDVRLKRVIGHMTLTILRQQFYENCIKDQADVPHIQSCRDVILAHTC